MAKKIISGSTGAMTVFANGRELNDVTSVTLADVEIPTTEIKGAGIMGTLNIPQTGQVNAMTVEIALRRTGKDKAYLMAQGKVDIEVRMATDVRASDGSMYVEGTKIFATGYATKIGNGKAEPGSTRDESVSYSVTRYREIIDGEETILIDQESKVFKVCGKDRMREVRSILY